MNIFQDITENKCVNKRHLFVKGNYLTKYCAITGKQCEIGCKLVLLTNMRSHKYGFRLISELVTLYDLERCNDYDCRRALSLK